MTEEQTKKDPLLVFAEAYNVLVASKKGFRNEPPKVKGLEVKDNIMAYFDRKLFVHNKGHAVIAYLGYLTDPTMKYVWEALNDEHVLKTLEEAMWESGRALIAEYPTEFDNENMMKYTNDVIQRLGNRALRDTLYRIGRDLPRKLSRNERLVGALLIGAKHGVPAPCTTLSTAASMFFRARDDEGNLFREDQRFMEEIYPKGIDYVLREICGLNPRKDQPVIGNIKKSYQFLLENPRNWFAYLDL